LWKDCGMDRKAILVIGGAAVVTGGVFVFTPPQLNPDAGLNNGLAPAPTPDPTITSASPTPSQSPQSTQGTPKKNKPAKSSNGQTVISGVEIESEKTDAPATASQTPTATAKATPSPTASAKPTPTPTPVVKPTPTPTPTPPPPPVVKTVNGTFTGDAINVSYGIVQVRITVTDSKITDAQAIQSPTGGKSGSISASSIPILRQETLAAQSAAIRGVSGASFTSNGWIRSLSTAISRAGI
jgi:uncharacterized protein with FMN-binding domain